MASLIPTQPFLPTSCDRPNIAYVDGAIFDTKFSLFESVLVWGWLRFRNHPDFGIIRDIGTIFDTKLGLQVGTVRRITGALAGRCIIPFAAEADICDGSRHDLKCGLANGWRVSDFAGPKPRSRTACINHSFI